MEFWAPTYNWILDPPCSGVTSISTHMFWCILLFLVISVQRFAFSAQLTFGNTCGLGETRMVMLQIAYTFTHRIHVCRPWYGIFTYIYYEHYPNVGKLYHTRILWDIEDLFQLDTQERSIHLQRSPAPPL